MRIEEESVDEIINSIRLFKEAECKPDDYDEQLDFLYSQKCLLEKRVHILRLHKNDWGMEYAERLKKGESRQKLNNYFIGKAAAIINACNMFL